MASPWIQVMRSATPACVARARARASIAAEASRPVTRKPAAARGTVSRPVPQPTSSSGDPTRSA